MNAGRACEVLHDVPERLVHRDLVRGAPTGHSTEEDFANFRDDVFVGHEAKLLRNGEFRGGSQRGSSIVGDIPGVANERTVHFHRTKET